MIPFNDVPSNLRIPFCAVEFDASRAQQGPALITYRALLIGQKILAGTAAANSLHKVTNADQVAKLAGRGSQLHRMAIKWFANNKFTECWIGVLEDNATGVAATGKITFTGPSTAAGTISLYIAGDLVTVAIADASDATAIASAVVAAINAKENLPVTATSSLGVVTLTARNKGTCGNDIDVRVNYQDGEVLPAGVGVTVEAMANGATNPALTTLIAALGDTWYHIWAHPYTDATSLTTIENELSTRFGPMKMIDGVAYTSAKGSYATLSTLGDGRNSPHSCIIAQPGSSVLTPPAEFAAGVAAVIAYHANIDPARPLQTLQIKDVRAPKETDLFTNEERNLLLHDGIGTTKAENGVVQIERPITTYKTNAAGVEDASYLDSTTMLTLLYSRYSFRNRVLSRYPRHKLANDGTRFGAGQPVVTPKLMKAEAVSWFRELEELGLFEGFDQFKRDLVVERNAQDPNRIDILLPPDLINQLIVTAAQIQFRL